MPTKPEATPEETEYEVTVSLLSTQQSPADALRDFLLSMSYDQNTIAATVRNTATGEVFNGSLEDLAAQDNIEDVSVSFLITSASYGRGRPRFLTVSDFLRSAAYGQDTIAATVPTEPEATPYKAQYEVSIYTTVRNTATGEDYMGPLEDLGNPNPDPDGFEDVPFLTTQQSPADAIRDYLLHFLRSTSYDQDTTAVTPRIIPAIEPTAEQWAVLDTIHDPYPKAASNGDIAVYEIKDDSSVALYTIKPDGSYIVEALLNGFHHGWTTLDAEGYQLEYNRDTKEMIRISDTPVPDWDL